MNQREPGGAERVGDESCGTEQVTVRDLLESPPPRSLL